jgi:hypothetical protein
MSRRNVRSRLVTEMATPDRKLTEPLWTVTGVFGGLIIALAALAAVTTLIGSGSFGGIGRRVAVCAIQPNTSYGGSDWTAHLGVASQPGATISINGTLQACALHPSGYQRLMFTLTSAPSALVWAAVLLLLWRIVRTARLIGPFTLLVAARMRWLGWVVLLGALAAACAQGAAADALLNTLLRPQAGFADALTSLPHILPVPLLAWAALLTFGRIIRLGVAMDEDIQGTV